MTVYYRYRIIFMFSVNMLSFQDKYTIFTGYVYYGTLISILICKYLEVYNCIASRGLYEPVATYILIL